jgi:tetratricopeptide (TPR) repeat protein
MHNAEQQTQTLLATRVLSRAFQNADMNEEARFLFQKRLLPDLLACFRNIQAYILNKKSVKAEALDDVKSLADVLQAQGFQAKAEGLYDWVSERISKVVERQSPPHPSQAEESPRHTHPTQEHKRQSSPDVIYHIYQPISGPQPLVYSPPPPPTPSSRQPDAPKSRIVYVPYATADTPDGVYGSSKPMKQVPPLPSQETNTDEEGPGLVILRDLVSVYLERKEYAHASETLTRLLSTQVLNHGEKSKNVVGTRRLLEEVRHMTEDAVDPISPLKASRSSTSFRPFPLPQYLEPSRFLHSPSPSVAPAAHIDSSTTAHTNDQDRLELLRDLGEEYLEGQDYAHAEEVFKRLYNAEVSALGPRDPSSLATAHKLATILVNRGNYTSAERKFTQILSAREEVLGKQHADTLDTQRRIQELRSTSSVRQDNAAAANPQPLASPIGTQQELNNPLYPGDPPALEILHANAVKLFQEGHIDHAYQLADYVLLARQKVLGPQHPLTLETLNLAETIRLKGEQACNILGGLPPPFSPSSQPAPPDPAHQASHVEPLAPEPKPPSTPKHRNETSASLTVLHENAVVLRREGKQAHAKALLEYVLVERQKLLGPQHPDTLETLKCLEASIGNVDDDHPTLAPSRTTRDFPHPRAPLVPASTQSPAPTPQSTNQKPSTLDKDSDPVTKERKETPASLKILHDNAVALMNKGEDAHAIELFKYVYLERQKVLRPQHPDTLETLKYLEKLLPRNTNATVYIDSSIKPSRTAPQPPSPQASLAPPSSTSSPNPTQSANPRLDANDRVLESPGSLDILHANAVELAENGNLSHAEELFEYVLSSRQRILGGRHPATLETQKSLTDVQRKLASPASSSHTSRTAYSSLPFFTRGHSASAPPSQSSRSAYRPSPTSPAAGPTPYTTGQIRVREEISSIL